LSVHYAQVLGSLPINGLEGDQWRSPRSPAARRGHAHSGDRLQREINLNESARFTRVQEAAFFERKVALSFAQGSGAIEWLWNTNSYMTEANEAPIGAGRTDSTEEPEASVMRDFACFAKSFQNHQQNPKQPSVAIVTSQAGRFSATRNSKRNTKPCALSPTACTSLLTSLPKTRLPNWARPSL